jgi:spore coat protein U-like protein
MTKNIKINKKTILKTTTALTCLIGAVLLFNQTANAAPTTSAGTMAVSTSVGAVCSVTATELAFGTFANSGSVANSSSGGVVSTNCSSALVHTLKVTESSASGVYTMITGDGVAAEKKITFKLYTAANAGGTQLSEAVAFATATGSAVSAEVATIFGQIAASQTGKEAGSYTKSIAVSVTYGA